RRHQAVAVPRGRGRARRPAGDPADVPEGGRGGSGQRQAAESEQVQDRAGQALPRARAPYGGDRMTSGARANMSTTQDNTASPIGRDTPRVDGPIKVSGRAQYTSDFHFPGMLYAVPVEATIANGRVTGLDTAAAEKMPGVRAILHRE